jgi:hypothetical protein
MLATSEQPTFWSIVGGSIVLANSLTRAFSRLGTRSFPPLLVLFFPFFRLSSSLHQTGSKIERDDEHDWVAPA